MIAQTTQAISYQGLARDNSGIVLSNQLVALRLSILSGSAAGIVVYSDTHLKTTDANGLFAALIGQGSVLSGTFAAINWGSGLIFLKVEMDAAGGSNYQVVGTSQFASVPFSLYAANGMPAGQNQGDILYWNGSQWVPVPAGSDNQVLRINNAVPGWSSLAGIPVVITGSATGMTNTTAICGGNVSDGGAPVTDRGVCWSSSPGPTISGNHVTAGAGSGVFSTEITGLLRGNTYFARAYATNSQGTGYGDEISFVTAFNWICGDSMTIQHVAGVVAPFDSTITYGTTRGIPGDTTKCWITQNLGATHQAESMVDPSSAATGWFWQFGLKQGYAFVDFNRIPPTPWNSFVSGSTDWQSDNDPCSLELGAGWHIPTNNDWNNVMSAGGWVNWSGPWESALKLHAAGFVSNNYGTYGGAGNSGVYWSSTQSGGNGAYQLNFTSYLCMIMGGFGVNNSTGTPLRCIH